MMEYFYTSTYLNVEEAPTFGLHTHSRVHAIAVKYNIGPLEVLAATKFAKSMNRVRDLEVYFTAVNEVYSFTPPENRGLRNVVISAAIVEMSKMLAEPRVKARLLEVMNKVTQFQGDVLQAMMDVRSMDEDMPLCDLLCQDCGPNVEGYEVEVQCRGCGQLRMYDFI